MAYQSTPGTEDDETELIAFDQRKARVRQQNENHYKKRYPNCKPRQKRSYSFASPITHSFLDEILNSPPKGNRK